MLSDNEIRELLQRAQTIAVVGLSDRPERDSNGVARFLQRNGYRIIPVNPNLRGPVLGEQPYASLRDVREHVDIVDIFRRPEYVPQIVEDAIAIGADVVWMQLGITNLAAFQRAKQAGLGVVMDRCMAIEHRRLMREVESILC
jgi:predicted CoA-binding protein